MEKPPILCPVCVALIDDGYTQWEALRATCPRCHLVLVLDEELVPLSPVAGYPDRLLALTEETVPDVRATVLVERAATTTRLRWAGLLRRHFTSVQVAPDRVAVSVLTSTRLSLDVPLAEVRGVVPTQSIAWQDTDAGRLPQSTWRLHLYRGATRYLLLTAGTWDEARRWTAALNTSLALARRPESAYRG